MTTITPTTLADLRARAEAATPGPWIENEGDIWWATHDGFMAQTQPNAPMFRKDRTYRRWGREFSHQELDASAAFIAAANPTTILDLCDALEARDAEIATLRAEVERLETAARGCTCPTHGLGFLHNGQRCYYISGDCPFRLGTNEYQDRRSQDEEDGA